MATNVIFRGAVEIVKPIQTEAPAATELKAGALVFKSSGEFAEFATDGGGAGVKLYLVDVNFLKQEAAATSTWASGDTTVAFEPRPAELYNALVATGQTLAKDSPLASNGDGTLRLGVVGTDDIIAYADEAVTTTAEQLVAIKF